MITPTYKEQFDKLTTAYISDKVNPYSCTACFVGNLLNNTNEWASGRSWLGISIENNLDSLHVVDNGVLDYVLKNQSNSFYTPDDIVLIEKNFIAIYSDKKSRVDIDHSTHEDRLFDAFESTLDLLKQIHISKGEIIDEVPVFTKRNLLTA